MLATLAVCAGTERVKTCRCPRASAPSRMRRGNAYLDEELAVLGG